MTDSELAEIHGVTRLTILNWKKNGRLKRKPGPPTKNRRGKPSYDWDLVTDAPAVTQTPKWQLFERKCVAVGKDPTKVLELLLSRCRSEYMGNATFGIYGDPDMFVLAVYMVLAGVPSFLDTIFYGGGPPTLGTAIGELIRANDGDLVSLDCPSFQDTWVAAKQYVGSSLQGGEWRYNSNPSVIVFPGKGDDFPDKGAMLMVPRWHNKLSREARQLLRNMGWGLSTAPGEFFSDDPKMDAFILTVRKLMTEFGENMKERTLGALKQFRWLWLGNDDGDEMDFEAAFETPDQKAAVQWFTEHTGAPMDLAISFAHAWARRYQGKISQRPTQTLINGLFHSTRGVPIPRTSDWSPDECVKAEPQLSLCRSEAKLDWIKYNLGAQDGPSPARKRPHEYDGGDMSDADGRFDDMHKAEARLDKKCRRESQPQESDYVPGFGGDPVSKWKEWRHFEGYAANRYGDG